MRRIIAAMNSKSAENEVEGSIQMVDLTRDGAVRYAKTLRVGLDEELQNLKSIKGIYARIASTELEDKNEVMAQLTLAQRDLESSIMRLGMVLKNIGTPNPYPESYNPASPVVAPTADGLKL
jgi:hypothetical protein